MEVFRLLDLEQQLLEKVITKVTEKSYFRLRETCSGMDEFIKASTNISVRLDRHFRFRLIINRHGPAYWLEFLTNQRVQRGAKLDVFHGVQLDRVTFSPFDLSAYDNTPLNKALSPAGASEQFGHLCRTLKKNRITSRLLMIPSAGIEGQIKAGVTIEQFTRLFEILRPVNLHLNSRGSSLYEILLQLKGLKSVHLFMNLNDVFTAAPKLFAAFPEVAISSPFEERITGSVVFESLRKILQILRSSPNVNKFQFEISGLWRLGARDAFEEELHDFNLREPIRQPYGFSAFVGLPQHLPNGSFCQVIAEYGESVMPRRAYVAFPPLDPEQTAIKPNIFYTG